MFAHGFDSPNQWWNKHKPHFDNKSAMIERTNDGLDQAKRYCENSLKKNLLEGLYHQASAIKFKMKSTRSVASKLGDSTILETSILVELAILDFCFVTTICGFNCGLFGAFFSLFCWIF